MTSKVTSLLQRIYPHLADDEVHELRGRLRGAIGIDPADPTPKLPTGVTPLPGADEVMLITYGDTLQTTEGSALDALTQFHRRHLREAFSTIHMLPFFPSSSDGGFAVVDYRSVDPAVGDWSDVDRLSADVKLMFDLVCNHGSAQSEWFQQFVADEEPGRSFFVTADPADDLDMVVRPRTHPLLRRVDTAAGERHVWATFSHDQIDFDFANPEVLVEFASILGHYLDCGADRIRLDAIAYLWKQLGTTCIHLPETHAVVKVMRALVEERDPYALLISETNVPHAENVSYFGLGDEAHVVYNFTLAPLIVWSLLAEEATAMTRWLSQLETPPRGCTFLNFIASHDGIGMRPVEDQISSDDLALIVKHAVAAGGDYSAYATPSGPRPYELNVSLADLLAGRDGEYAVRYELAHALMLAVQGIPAVYIHSMLATPGDEAAVEATGHKRDINRSRLLLDQAEAAIGSGWRAQAFEGLVEMIRLRRTIDAFAPEAEQRTHSLHPQIVAIERGSGPDAVFALNNVSAEPLTVELPPAFVRTRGPLVDLRTGEYVDALTPLDGWQARWICAASVPSD